VFPPEKLLLAKPTPTSEALVLVAIGFTDFDPFFRAKRPVWGTKNPRADLFFLTRPLRPQLNSQLIYPNCSGCQQCIFHRFLLPVSPNGEAGNLIWFGNPGHRFILAVPASTYNLAKNVLQNLVNADRQRNNFFKKISASRVTHFRCVFAIPKNKGANNKLIQNLRKSFFDFFFDFLDYRRKLQIPCEKGQFPQRDRSQQFRKRGRIGGSR
jgi:hypothetical protein